MNENIIYLDNAASTPISPETIDAMTTVLSDCYGNPSGAHKMAREARRLIDDARDTLSHGLGCDPKEVIFTAGGTEADNLAIFGTKGSRDGTILASATDHHAVIAPVEQLGGQFIQVDENGLLDLCLLYTSPSPRD